MGKKCVVPNCRSGYNKNPEKVTLFGIPKDNLQQYIRAIARKDRNLTEKDHVCEKHFKPESIIREIKTAFYTIPLKVPKLQKGAIPSIFSNYCPKYISKNLPQKRREIVKHDDGAVKRKKSDLETETQISEASVTTEEMETYEGTIVESPFETLWGKHHEILKLPSSLWHVHSIENAGNNLIAVTKLVPFENNAILEKKIIVNENFTVDCYMFEHLTNLAQNIEIGNIDQLNDFLVRLDNFSPCYGGSVKVPDNFKSSVYRKDSYCQSWRHAKCDFIVTSESTSARLNRSNEKKYKRCNFCKKIDITLRSYVISK